MRKKILIWAVMALMSVPSFAQYWTTTNTYDPFKNGDKSIGLSVGTGMWFGPSEALISGADYGYDKGRVITDVSRNVLNPSIALHYKRVLQGNTVDWGNSFFLSYSKWGGKIEGNNSGNDTATKHYTFTKEYSWSEVTLSDMFYLMIPIGDNIKINAGLGLTIGIGLPSKSSYTRSDGVTSDYAGMSFSDLIIGRINVMAGVDYALSDSFTLNANIIGWPFDIFGLMNEHKNMRAVGNEFYVNTKLPFQLTVGFTYAL